MLKVYDEPKKGIVSVTLVDKLAEVMMKKYLTDEEYARIVSEVLDKAGEFTCVLDKNKVS